MTNAKYDLFGSVENQVNSVEVCSQQIETVISNPSVKQRSKERFRDVQYTMDSGLFGTVPKYAPNNEEFDQAEIAQLRAWMLERNLDFLLDDRTESETVYDILDWFVSDEVHPFSFRVCASAAFESGSYIGELFSLSDITEFRELVIFQVSRKRKDIDLSGYKN